MNPVPESDKAQATRLIAGMPDETSLEQIRYHLYVLERLREGEEDLAAGRTYTHEQARQYLSKWLD